MALTNIGEFYWGTSSGDKFVTRSDESGNLERVSIAGVSNGYFLRMDCGTSTGTGSQQELSHNLNAVPTVIVLQDTTTDQSCAALALSATATTAVIKVTATTGKTYSWVAWVKQ